MTVSKMTKAELEQLLGGKTLVAPGKRPVSEKNPAQSLFQLISEYTKRFGRPSTFAISSDPKAEEKLSESLKTGQRDPTLHGADKDVVQGEK